MTCEMAEKLGLPERYLAGRLSEAEAAEFESHYLTCSRCQEALRLGTAVRGAFADQRRPGRPRVLVVVAGLGLAAAAVFAFLMIVPGPDPAITGLGAVGQPPIYLGVPVRADEGAGDSAFAAAMRAYARESYEEAAAGLRAALELGVDRPPAEFFLGASLLMIDRPEDAAQAFGRVIELGDSPYLAEARLYRAKALLRLGDAQHARQELERVDEPNTVIGNYARALADSIVEALRR
jgi:hypothetical protein